jgi:replicative DNA helicase
MAREHEERLLGSLISDNELIEPALASGLSSEMFQHEKSLAVKIFNLAGQNIPFDIESLTHHHSEEMLNISRCVSAGLLSYNPESDISEIIGQHIRKKATQILHLTYEKINSWQPYQGLQVVKDLLNTALTDVQELDVSASHKSAKGFEMLLQQLENYEQHRHEPLNSLKTGIKKLDELIAAYGSEIFIILTARTSVGKTSLACNMLINAMLSDWKPAYFSVEVSQEKLNIKILCALAEVPIADYYLKRLTDQQWDRIADAARTLRKCTWHLNTSVRKDFTALEKEVRRLHRLGKLDFLIIDYIQQFRIPGFTGTKVDMLGEITNRTQSLVTELKIPVLALAQLNRTALNLQLHEPILGCLKGSGELEQDADVVMHLAMRSTDTNDKNLRQIKIDKNRDGRTGSFPVVFDFETGRFKDC